MDTSYRCLKCEQVKPAGQFSMKGRGKHARRKKWCDACCLQGSADMRRARQRKKAAAARAGIPMPTKGISYEQRNANLKRIGFQSYADYLKSDLWRSIRAEVFRTQGRNCYLCGAPATQLHHNRYHERDLLGKKTKFIKPICGPCHRDIEFADDKKVPLKLARREFLRRRRLTKGNTSAKAGAVLGSRVASDRDQQETLPGSARERGGLDTSADGSKRDNGGVCES